MLIRTVERSSLSFRSFRSINYGDSDIKWLKSRIPARSLMDWFPVLYRYRSSSSWSTSHTTSIIHTRKFTLARPASALRLFSLRLLGEEALRTEFVTATGTSPPGWEPPYYLDNLNLCTRMNAHSLLPIVIYPDIYEISYLSVTEWGIDRFYYSLHRGNRESFLRFFI